MVHIGSANYPPDGTRDGTIALGTWNIRRTLGFIVQLNDAGDRDFLSIFVSTFVPTAHIYLYGCWPASRSC